jgi:YidC/Oxa1 family membrane protein insertase
MGLAMVVQMRVQATPGSGAQAKVFMYLMPAFIFFIFNQFAAALSLYYLVYNIVSAAQQQWINMQLEKEKDEDGNLMSASSNGSNGQGEEKKGFLERLVERAESKAEERQKR